MATRIRAMMRLVVGSLTVMAMGAIPALAAPVLTFDNLLADGGNVSHTAGGPLVAVDILFDNLKAEGTSADGSYFCDSCKLSFSTGAATTEGPTVWDFGGGGSIEMRGAIPSMGITDTSTVLLSGSWTSTPPNIATGAGSNFTFTGFGMDVKNADMLEFLGVAAEDWRFVESTVSLGEAVIETDGSFTATVTDADLVNRVPEPATTLLMLLGVTGLALRRRYNS